jgi:hypothetical protein
VGKRVFIADPSDNTCYRGRQKRPPPPREADDCHLFRGTIVVMLGFLARL